MAGTKDYYGILGVKKSATNDEIKKAYKQLARKYHPDLNQGDSTAEQKFKDVSEAYAVLGDKDKRAKYDRFGSGTFGDDFSRAWSQARQGGAAGGMDFGRMNDFGFNLDDILGDIFSGNFSQARRGHPKKQDYEMQMPLTFVEATNGATKTISLDGKQIDVKIPAGVEKGSKVRLAGKGKNGGDLYLICDVQGHPFFKLEGLDVHLDLPISLSEAIEGAVVAVPTISGRVDLRIPPGASGGQKMKLKAKGAKHSMSGRVGDQIVRLQIKMPALNEQQKSILLSALAEIPADPNIRKHLGL